ncbi:hypothetical protein AMTRI_Chr02g217280 [Amborella trichopoda]
MCSDMGARPERDELDFEFLGNRSSEPYIIQSNIYKGGVESREMRHSLWFDPTEDFHTYSLWFDPTEDFHTYSILWNNHHNVFFVDRVGIRIYRNTEASNDAFPNEKPMYIFSSIWNADDWATRGGLEKTDWKNASFVSTYKNFQVDACQWKDPYPDCVSTTTQNWWDQSEAWTLSTSQREDFSWVGRNLIIYDYCHDTNRYPKLPNECINSPWD